MSKGLLVLTLYHLIFRLCTRSDFVIMHKTVAALAIMAVVASLAFGAPMAPSQRYMYVLSDKIGGTLYIEIALFA